MSFERRLLRGGSWFDFPQLCRSAYRDRMRPAGFGNAVGFRVVCQPSTSPSFMSQIRQILRGGSWFNSPVLCRSAFRDWWRPANSNNYVGFRVVCQPSPSFFMSILQVLRGGSWFFRPQLCRSACRGMLLPADSHDVVGFRVVCQPSTSPSFMSQILRILRSGSWFGLPQDCRSAYRIKMHPTGSSSHVGFRLISNNSAAAIEMVEIPAGSFLMGSPPSEEGHFTRESPQHEVTLSAFWMSQFPITQAQWEYVMGTNPSHFKGEDLPVECVSWHDAMEFCRRLSQQTGHTYTLPSEAQWEYACRAGTTTPFSFGDTITPSQANYDGNYTYGNGPKGEYRRRTTPVGMFPANDWGLHDMHGNVWEWCLDEWHPNYEGAPVDGSAWEGGDE